MLWLLWLVMVIVVVVVVFGLGGGDRDGDGADVVLGFARRWWGGAFDFDEVEEAHFGRGLE